MHHTETFTGEVDNNMSLLNHLEIVAGICENDYEMSDLLIR